MEFKVTCFPILVMKEFKVPFFGFLLPQLSTISILLNLLHQGTQLLHPHNPPSSFSLILQEYYKKFPQHHQDPFYMVQHP